MPRQPHIAVSSITSGRDFSWDLPQLQIGRMARSSRLCQENLVFQASIHQGIETGDLCAFRYFGVPDEVDYQNIPWRNSQFDITELERAVATEARARNAFEQFRKSAERVVLASAFPSATPISWRLSSMVSA